MNEIEIITEKLFENVKHIDEDGNEYWEARELQKVLDYKEWRKFEGIIKKSISSCESAGDLSTLHFVQTDKMLTLPNGGSRIIKDYKLSRYACYLIVMLGDEHKEVISLGRKYFAIQTRRSELRDKTFENLSEDNKRLILREETRKHNKTLNREAIKKGVRDLAKFTNKGYMGLYDGETANDIARRKNLRYREEILDYMGSEELGANVFRITQTEAALKRQLEIDGKKANDTHYKVGSEVRNTIKRIGGTMPEDLPTPSKTIKDINDDKLQCKE